MFRLTALVLCALCLLPLAKCVGIPGTTQTMNGYDTEMGTDAICWQSQSATEGIPMPNPLIADYIVSMAGITLLQECPKGCNMTGTPPKEVLYGERLRTGREYLYSVKLSLNLTSLGATAGLTSDRGPGILAVQILNCAPLLSGFCSPFVHEEANARLAAARNAFLKANPNSTTPAAKKVRGALHGGSHVHSGFVDVILNMDEGPVFQDIEVVVPMVVLVPGEYISVASAQLYFWDNTTMGSDDPQMYRYDIANALPQRFVAYQDPAEILEVPNEVVYVSYVLIGISSCVILFLLIQTIIHRNNQVMKLSQGYFLIAFLIAGLIATATSFLMEPKSDFYCRASIPICLISLQIFYAVTAGRLWRIHTLISPLLLKTLSLKKDTRWNRFTQRCQQAFSRCFRWNSRPRKFRTQVTDLQLAAFVFLLVSPQLVLQILALILQPQSRSVDFNEDESKGRAECDTEDDIPIGQTIVYYGYGVFAFLMFGLLVTALRSRKMPSLFHESKKIFDATLGSLIILIFGVAVMLVTRDPATSPAVSYLIWIFSILSMTLNTSLRIVLPKLRMIWRGETVVVSKLVMDHTRDVRQSNVLNSLTSSAISDPEGSDNKPYIYDQTTLANNTSQNSNSLRQNRASGASFSSSIEHTHMRSSDMIPSETEPDQADSTIPPRRVPKVTLDAPIKDYELEQATGVKKRKKKFVIESDEAPSRRLLLKMVDMQEHLNRVNERLLSGLAVSHEEWESTRRMAGKLGDTFHDDVEFSWEFGGDEEEEQGHTPESTEESHHDQDQTFASHLPEEDPDFDQDQEDPVFDEEPPLGERVGI